MKSITTFQEHMLHNNSGNYINRYCNQLTSMEWKLFYSQMKEPLEFIVDEKYLFYMLKWILKEPYTDLSFEVYLQVIQNPEQISEPLIKDEWMIILNTRYEFIFYKVMIESQLVSVDNNSESNQYNLLNSSLDEVAF